MIARIFAVILILALVASSAGYLIYAFAADEDDYLAAQRLEALPDLLMMIKDNYRDERSLLELVNAAYKGVFDSLDEWSEYYSSLEEEQDFVSAVNPNYSGIGVTNEDSAAGVRIAEVNPYGPAYEAGVQAGSFVKSLDGKSAAGMTAAEVAAAMRGEPGTTLVLVLEKDGKEQSFTLTRKTIPDTTIEALMLEGNIGYLHLRKIAQITDSEFLLAHTDLVERGAKALVLDLRGCPGGYMNAAASIAEEFMPKGSTIATYVRQGKTVETITSDGSSIKQLPTVVLIDEDTASAAEMLAGALQDCGAAQVVGTVSFGKGVAQGITELGNDDAVRISIVYFVTPNGRYIEGKGIRPDYIVYNGYNFTAAQIAQLTAGVTPMDEGKKYSAGQNGRNVLAAQQRLKLLGYDVDPTSYMDEKTVEAIKIVQMAGGGSPYGGLDFGTMAMIEARYQALCTAGAGDLQLAKAIELLKK